MHVSRRLFLGSATAFAVTSTMGRNAITVSATQAATIHTRLLTLDTHLDTPMNFARLGWDIMDRHSYAADLNQVDYPRMRQGGLCGGFFAIYTPQGALTSKGYAQARDAALLRAVEIREMVAKHGDTFELAFTAADAERIHAKQRRIVFQSIENSWPLGEDLSLMETFYKLGVRLIGPVHFRNNQLADSATDTGQWQGLSPLGKQFVAEANRLGMIIDQSHASDDVFDQLIELSKPPFILSHSSCRAVCDHPRNLDDARMKKLAAKGGTIQINSLSAYLIPTPKNPARAAAQAAIYAKLEGPTPKTTAESVAQLHQLAAELHALDKQYPQPRATFDDYMKHLLHALDTVGPDHVGIGCDWDGGGGDVDMEDVAALPKITAALLNAGYDESELRQIWGGNVLRVMRAVEVAKE